MGCGYYKGLWSAESRKGIIVSLHENPLGQMSIFSHLQSLMGKGTTMYELMLTHEERRAFTMMGYRYAAGDIMDLLIRKCEHNLMDQYEFVPWTDSHQDITFQVPEVVASEIQCLAAEEDYMFPCFADSLREKMQRFCKSII